MKVLITAPLKQERKIFAEFQEGLDKLEIPDGVEVDRFYVVNDCAGIIRDIRGEYIIRDTGDRYVKTDSTHIWNKDNLNKMHELRNLTIQRMLEGGYDYWWSIDTDLVVQPTTLKWLLEADKDIVTEGFWTNGWCNAWLYDQATGMREEWKKPGLYKIGMSGACTLVKRKVFEAGVDFTPIPVIKKCLWGEDRHFCIRAVCAGFEHWLDTHAPPYHLYTEKHYREYMRRKKDGNA